MKRKIKIFINKMYHSQFARMLKSMPEFIYYSYCHKKLINELKSTSKINIVFIISNLAMWKCQKVYDLFAQNPKFNISLLIIPFLNYSEDQKRENINQMIQYFKHLNLQFEIIDDPNATGFREKYKPHIVFYPQMYGHTYPGDFDLLHNLDRLVCYVPYGLSTTCNDFVYDSIGCVFAWKNFVVSEMHKEEAKHISRIRDWNVFVCGNPTADLFTKGSFQNVWKKQNKIKKKVIIAPHFTIKPGLSGLCRSSFLDLASTFLELTEMYKDEIQFAFKPHPRLKTELEKEDVWGKEKTAAYYSEWEKRSNTQLETGAYIDLFMTSDAMIHDSCTFTAEYHYTSNPVLFTTLNPDGLIKSEKMGQFGEMAFRLHYFGDSKKSLINFLNDVVLKGHDPLKVKRDTFRKDYLLSNKRISCAELIYTNICNSLGVKY